MKNQQGNKKLIQEKVYNIANCAKILIMVNK